MEAEFWVFTMKPNYTEHFLKNTCEGHSEVKITNTEHKLLDSNLASPYIGWVTFSNSQNTLFFNFLISKIGMKIPTLQGHDEN